MKLIQIPFSHNCIKVRRALQWKGVEFSTEDVNPVRRQPVRAASGQGLVPVLVDGDRVVCDSTAILLYLEEALPNPPLLPRENPERAECLLLEDWADTAFMALTRRVAYWRTLALPGALEQLFFPRLQGPPRRVAGLLARRALRRRFGLSAARHRRDRDEVARVASLAVDRLGSRSFLVGDRMTLADITLAAMSAPLWAAEPELRGASSVHTLLQWGRGILGEELVAFYLPSA